jgi:hypothetical protein
MFSSGADRRATFTPGWRGSGITLDARQRSRGDTARVIYLEAIVFRTPSSSRKNCDATTVA